MKRKLRIVFMGTPEFAVDSLDILVKNGYDVAGVVTAPDRPAGRGKKLRSSAVKEYALSKNLYLMQPANLKDEGFIHQLRSLETNLQVIVAFRMLPEVVWSMPAYGSFNLHASLLPDYRGAAPMNRAIINGEQETGVTTFFLNDKIDTGDIIFMEKVTIGKDETVGQLHDRLKTIGAKLVLKTVRAIEENKVKTYSQQYHTGLGKQLHLAPKITSENCRINWANNVEKIHNLIRGLSPLPGAYTELESPSGERYSIKIFRSVFEKEPPDQKPGTILTDSKHFLAVTGNDGIIQVMEIQLSGKNRMDIEGFLRGFNIDQHWKIVLF
jgi:methionyl-tRNA formyltransferase